jgi:hypothetical protein
VNGSFLYIADGPEGLQVLDLSVPAKPAVVATHKTATAARDVAVSDSLVFLLVAARDAARQDDGEVVILRQKP